MDSMEEVCLKYGKMIYGFLLTRTQDPDLAEELIQEMFYQAVKNIGAYKGKNSVSTWFCGTAGNLWYEHLRKQRRHVPLGEAVEIPVDSAEKQMPCPQDNIQILRLVHGLEDSMREIICLRLIGNLTSGQIGEIMEKSENQARVTYCREKERVMKEAERLRTIRYHAKL